MSDRILVVDDEPGMALGMAQALRRRGFIVDTAGDGREALSILAQQVFAVVFTDLRMPGVDGRELVRRIRSLCPSTQVVVVTAFATVESAVSCIRNGATDYLMKPFTPDALEQAARAALNSVAVQGGGCEEVDLVAEDPVTLAAVDLTRRAAGSDITVLLEAESGAGKEVFARMIHRESPRNLGPFVAVNCAALPRELLEAELFGHTRGAFTGAHRERKGHFQTANGGSLLLDEIGEMNTDLQARLLRVLQDRTIQPVGSDSSVRVDVRVIAATNRNLRQDVAEGRFREDLYYRLRVMPIRIPPLRERRADIEPLARRFARRYGSEQTRLSDRAMEKLRQHDWPGNVRELQNAVQRATVLAVGETIDAEHLMLEPALIPAVDPATNDPVSLEDAERDVIRRTLIRTGGNRTEAAEALGISARTLRHKLKQYRDAGQPVGEPA